MHKYPVYSEHKMNCKFVFTQKWKLYIYHESNPDLAAKTQTWKRTYAKGRTIKWPRYHSSHLHEEVGTQLK